MSRWKLNESKRRAGWLVLIGPYDPEFLAEFKRRVPQNARIWEPGLRAWLVKVEVRELVEEIVDKHSEDDHERDYEAHEGAEP